MLLDYEQKRLVDGVATKLDPSYMLQLNGLPIGPKTGSCGTAAFEKDA